MNIKQTMAAAMIGGSLTLAPVAGCESLPGSSKEQGAVIGGVGGAAAGAAVGGDDNRVLGALIGGAAGAVGGYLIGAEVDKTDGDDDDIREAQTAVENAQSDPATAADVRAATTADLNRDGFVTTDEVIAMADANLSDNEIIGRLQATGQVFELTTQQEEYLIDQGVSAEVVRRMQTINQTQRDEIISR